MERGTMVERKLTSIGAVENIPEADGLRVEGFKVES